MTPKIQQLKNLANQFPAQAANDINAALSKGDASLQQAVAQSPTAGLDITKAAQGVGGSMAAAQGQAAAQAQGQAASMMQSVGQLGMQASNIESSKRLADAAFRVDEEAQKQAEALDKLDNNYKNQLLDKQLAFNKDKRGNYILQQRQLFDLAALKARDVNEFNNYARGAQLANKRYLQMLQTAHAKVLREMEQKWKYAEQKKDQQMKLEIQQQINAQKAALKRAENRAKNRMAAWQAGGMVVGAAAGAAIGWGNPATAAAGASAGSQMGAGLGTYAGSQT